MHEIREAVLHLLWKYGIKSDTWGTGSAKTLNHLIDEVSKKECILHEENGSVYRVTRTLGINVYYGDDAKLLILRERMQVFVGGRIRTRNLDTSLGEKVSPDETPLHAAVRALWEELGIEVTPDTVFRAKFPYLKGPQDSTSYPGLKTIHHIYPFDVTIPPIYYRPEGYVEAQVDKTTYFGWDEVQFD